MSDNTLGKYPLLETLLSAKGLPVKGVWTIADVAQIFNVQNRAIYDWINNQKLSARDLPGRGRFLSEDLETLALPIVTRACELCLSHLSVLAPCKLRVLSGG
jgi:hypothetical protein